MSDFVKEIAEADFDLSIAQGTSLCDFWAPWCGPCRMVAPHVEAVAEKMTGQAQFFKINVDDNQKLAIRLGIQSIPTMVVFQNGKEVERMIGARGRADIEKVVAAWANGNG